VERAASLGCDAMQIFGRNPRSWIYTPLPAAEAGLFRAKRAEAGLKFVAVHTNYLINLCSPDDGIYYKSIDIFKKELAIAEAIGADCFVTHLGSPREMGADFAVKRVGLALRETAAAGLGEKSMMLLENTAGAGYGFGADLGQIGEIISTAARDGIRTGLCLDTCHAFAAGYSYSTPGEVSSFIDRVGSSVGLGNMRLIHLNDSKGALGANLDRHEHIGRGKIGIESFRLLLNRPETRGVPMILETPKKTDSDDPMNLAVVRGLFSSV